MPNGAGVMEGDEVSEYIAPFAFVVNEDGTDLDYTTGTRGHNILALIYKQNTGRVCPHQNMSSSVTFSKLR